MKQWSLLLVLYVFCTVLSAEPYGVAREKARQTAVNAARELERRYTEVHELIIKTPMTHDKRHDAVTVQGYEELYRQWNSYRVVKCDFEARLEVYPDTSLLFAQTVNNCNARMNKQFIKIINSVESSILSYK